MGEDLTGGGYLTAPPLTLSSDLQERQQQRTQQEAGSPLFSHVSTNDLPRLHPGPIPEADPPVLLCKVHSPLTSEPGYPEKLLTVPQNGANKGSTILCFSPINLSFRG